MTIQDWEGRSRLHDEVRLDERVNTFMTSQAWKEESYLHDRLGERVRSS